VTTFLIGFGIGTIVTVAVLVCIVVMGGTSLPTPPTPRNLGLDDGPAKPGPAPHLPDSPYRESPGAGPGTTEGERKR
jgi:hypothetical protein